LTVKTHSGLVEKREGLVTETVPAIRLPVLPLPDYQQHHRLADGAIHVVPLSVDGYYSIRHQDTPIRYIVVSVSGPTRDEFQVLDTKQGNKPVMMVATYLTAQIADRAVAETYAERLNRVAHQIALEAERARMATDRGGKLLSAGSRAAAPRSGGGCLPGQTGRPRRTLCG
jgi:hypothetical protein